MRAAAARRSEPETGTGVEAMQADNRRNVHTEHCCWKHGCKYGDDDCPVALGKKPQSFPCETCRELIAEMWDEAHWYNRLLDSLVARAVEAERETESAADEELAHRRRRGDE